MPKRARPDGPTTRLHKQLRPTAPDGYLECVTPFQRRQWIRDHQSENLRLNRPRASMATHYFAIKVLVDSTPLPGRKKSAPAVNLRIFNMF